MTLDPARLSPQDCYKILVGAVVPRPIAFVSSLSASGVRNLAPFSFFTVASSNPPVIVFQNSIRGDGTAKDTITNVRATGEFVVNIVSEGFAAAMNLTSGDYPPDVDEFALSGLTPVESEAVKPQRVGESHVQMECKLLQIVEVSDKPLGGALVLGEVVRFHLSEAVANEKLHIDPDKLRAIGRMAGTTYARTTDRFDMKRP
ncbi:MAG: flavin reductase family protein [Bryobacteraceae bacterium]|nr:flavin reductase family protein [Bryobacteraceae bacterium]